MTDEFDALVVAPYEAEVLLASTPDPDAPDCAECGGGLAHYPECSVVTQRGYDPNDDETGGAL